MILSLLLSSPLHDLAILLLRRLSNPRQPLKISGQRRAPITSGSIFYIQGCHLLEFLIIPLLSWPLHFISSYFMNNNVKRSYIWRSCYSIGEARGNARHLAITFEENDVLPKIFDNIEKNVQHIEVIIQRLERCIREGRDQ